VNGAASRAPRESASSAMNPPHPHAAISVVVLTYRRRAQVLDTVETLLALPEHAPVIVVDNASADGSAQALRERFGARIEIVESPGNLGAAARNLGVRRARTPYVAFCDDDVHWHPGALARAAALLDAHPRIAVLCARVLVGARGAADPASLAMAASPLPSDGLPGRAIVGFLAGASAMRVDAFLRCGGYRAELFIGGEEELLALDLLAAGWQLVYAPELVAHHHPSSLRDAPRRRSLLARNAVWTACMRYPARDALHRIGAELRDAARCGGLWPLLCESIVGLPWALRERRVVPRFVAAQMRKVRGTG
jgi:GT2 family glycosyltransferase